MVADESSEYPRSVLSSRRSRYAAMVIALCGVGLLSAWGAGAFAAHTIPSWSTQRILREAGFTRLTSLYIPGDDGGPDIEHVWMKHPRMTLPPVELLAYESSAMAKRFYAPGDSVRYVRREFGLARYDHLLPHIPGFSPRKAMSFRICNVILWSYNGRDDPQLAARVRRAAQLLRQACQ